MDKTGTNKPVVFLALVDPIRIHHKFGLQGGIAESIKTDNNCYPDKYVCNWHRGNFLSCNNTEIDAYC